MNNGDGNNDNENNDDHSNKKRRMEFKNRKKNVNHDYGNCNFIPEFSGVVERLWLMVNKLLNGNLSRTSRLLM